MSNYPNAVYTPRTKENKAGIVYDPTKTKNLYAEDITKDDAEIVALETELGTLPKGNFTDVKTRLDNERAWIILDKGVLSAGANNLFDKASLDTKYDLYKLTLRLKRPTNSVRLGLRINNVSSADYYSKVTQNGTATNYSGQTILPLNVTAVDDVSEAIFIINFMRGVNECSLPVSWQYTIFTQGTIYQGIGSGALDAPTDTITRVAIERITGTFGANSGWLLEGQDLE